MSADEIEAVEAPPPCAECNGTGKRKVLHRGTGETQSVTCPCKIDLPIRFIWQPENSGCGPAVLAMIAGLTYRQACQYFAFDRDFSQTGCYTSELREVLNVLGFSYQLYVKFQSRIGGTEREKWPMESVSDLAIAQVRNLRDALTHFVVVLRDGRVLDPAAGVVQGLHRYPEVYEILALFPIPKPAEAAA